MSGDFMSVIKRYYPEGILSQKYYRNVGSNLSMREHLVMFKGKPAHQKDFSEQTVQSDMSLRH
jgi:hypothetical protein